jgi:hypothetical protein
MGLLGRCRCDIVQSSTTPPPPDQPTTSIYHCSPSARPSLRVRHYAGIPHSKRSRLADRTRRQKGGIFVRNLRDSAAQRWSESLKTRPNRLIPPPKKHPRDDREDGIDFGRLGDDAGMQYDGENPYQLDADDADANLQENAYSTNLGAPRHLETASTLSNEEDNVQSLAMEDQGRSYTEEGINNEDADHTPIEDEFSALATTLRSLGRDRTQKLVGLQMILGYS